MSKNTARKTQEKKLKNRAKRAAHNRSSAVQARNTNRKVAQQHSRQDLKMMAQLLQRGAVINGKRIDNDSMSQLINYSIETSAGVSSTIEIAELLEKEGNFTIIPEMRELFDKFDKHSVLFNEDAEIIMAMIAGGGDVKEVPDAILMHIGEVTTELLTVMAGQVMDTIKDHYKVFDEYAKEHNPGVPYRDIMFKLAIERIGRITPKYATPVQADAEEVVEA